jgi:uncharacterized protein (DUF2141 family)
MVWKKWAAAASIAAAFSYCALPTHDAGAQVDNDPAANNTLTLEVTGIRKAEGRMACALFWQNKGFPRKHRRALRRTWVDVEGDTVRCVFKRTGLGEYAASVFLDINENGKLDTNAIGTPSEPWGVSQVTRSKRSGPSLYKDAKFEYQGGKVTIPIELVYE